MDTTEVKPLPTARAIDALILKYETAQREADTAYEAVKVKSAVAAALKQEITDLVEEFGVRHSDKSKRLFGNHNHATTTVATRSSVIAPSVERLRKYLLEQLPALQETFFTPFVTYQLVKSPSEVLRLIDVPTRVRTRLSSMIALCFEQKTSAPSLKIDVVKPE